MYVTQKCLLTPTMFRLMVNCEDFLIKQSLVKKKGEFFSDNPGDHTAHFIAAWIMNACVILSLFHPPLN